MEESSVPTKILTLVPYIRAIAVVFIFIVMAGAVYFGTVPALHSIYAKAVYQSTDGIVISCQSKIAKTIISAPSGFSASGYSKSYYVHYQYTVGGKRYSKESLPSLDSALEDNREPAAFCNSGERVAVYYSPFNPAHSRLTDNVFFGHLLFSAIAIFGLLQLMSLVRGKNVISNLKTPLPPRP